jgi:hypothetical protein
MNCSDETYDVKLYKVVVFIPDLNNDYANPEEVIEDIERHIDFSVAFLEEATDIEWTDDIDINKRTANRDTFESKFERK